MLNDNSETAERAARDQASLIYDQQEVPGVTFTSNEHTHQHHFCDQRNGIVCFLTLLAMTPHLDYPRGKRMTSLDYLIKIIEVQILQSKKAALKKVMRAWAPVTLKLRRSRKSSSNSSE